MKEQFTRINEYGTKFYFADRKMTILHREDGPAIECDNGSKWWCLNGKRHREDGPAFEGVSGYKAWWLNGEELTEAEWRRTYRSRVQRSYESSY